MKNKIIRIDDISDIKTSKVSVYDLNNRYIDSRGNIFGLRYNRLMKKVEIVKILRTHNENVSSIRQKVLKKKRDKSKKSQDGDVASTDEGLFDYGTEIDEEENFLDPEQFIEDTIILMHTHRERMIGIMNNVYKSKIISKDNKADKIQLDDIFRNIEIDAIQKFENAETYQKELTNYPRSIAHYQAKIDKNGREVLDKLTGQDEKTMRFIYIYEMLSSIKEVYRNLSIFIKNLITFLGSKDVETMKHLTPAEKQSYRDAEISINTTKDEIEKLRLDIVPIKDFITKIENL